MPFTDPQVELLLSFVGYGNPNGPVCFLGMEEGGGGEENLQRRLTYNRYEDLYEGHKKLGIIKHHERKRVIQRTWRGMCVIMLDLKGIEITRDNIRRYQSDSLGRKMGETFLAEMMPLPKPNIGDWGYETIIPQFKSREDYYARIMPKRIIYLRKILSKYSPAIVIGYGKGYWQSYKDLFPGAPFKQESIFQRSRQNPFIVLVPHFTSRAMNGRFEELSDLVRPAYKSKSA